MAVIGIVGPTASGKTALSLELAEALGGADSVEIVSADAMQLYRGMDVGTAKISPAERRGIVHRQIDVLDVLDEASVAAYQRSARADVDAILAVGKTPVVVEDRVCTFPGCLTGSTFRGEIAAFAPSWSRCWRGRARGRCWRSLPARTRRRTRQWIWRTLVVWCGRSRRFG